MPNYNYGAIAQEIMREDIYGSGDEEIEDESWIEKICDTFEWRYCADHCCEGLCDNSSSKSS